MPRYAEYPPEDDAANWEQYLDGNEYRWREKTSSLPKQVINGKDGGKELVLDYVKVGMPSTLNGMPPPNNFTRREVADLCMLAVRVWRVGGPENFNTINEKEVPWLLSTSYPTLTTTEEFTDAEETSTTEPAS